MSIYKGYCWVPNEPRTLQLIAKMFVNIFIQWAQLLSATMVNQEDVSVQTNFPSYFLIPVSEVQKIHQIQRNERRSELFIFQP